MYKAPFSSSTNVVALHVLTVFPEPFPSIRYTVFQLTAVCLPCYALAIIHSPVYARYLRVDEANYSSQRRSAPLS